MKVKKSARALKRISLALKTYQPILQSAKTKDSNETDTVAIIYGVLNDLFGYDKYSDITSEFSIRGTFCDLAIKLGDDVQILIEAKAIGLELKDNHIKQAVDYAANRGVDWVILTNGIEWIVFKVIFAKPVDKEVVLSFNLLDLNHKNRDEIARLYMLSKEGWQRSVIDDYHTQRKALDRFIISATILSSPSLNTIKRELRRVSPNTTISCSQIKSVIIDEIFKREVIEGSRAEEASKKVQRSSQHLLRKIKDKFEQQDSKEEVKNEEQNITLIQNEKPDEPNN